MFPLYSKQITLTSEEAAADTEKPTSKQNLNMIQVKITEQKRNNKVLLRKLVWVQEKL